MNRREVLRANGPYDKVVNAANAVAVGIIQLRPDDLAKVKCDLCHRHLLLLKIQKDEPLAKR